MPNKSRNETELSDPRQDRFETQLILGQIHGVLHFVVADTEDWFKGQPAQAPGEDDITAEDLRRSFADVSRSFGVCMRKRVTTRRAFLGSSFDSEIAANGSSSEYLRITGGANVS